MNKKISLGAAVAFMLIIAAATFSVTMILARTRFNSSMTDLTKSKEMYEKYAEIDRSVREKYYYEIDETLLMDSVARGYLTGIGDKYAMYISADEYKKLTQSKEGEDVGIGAVLSASPDGYLLVGEVYPDSPAQVAGIVAGDLIVKLEEDDITRENQEQILASIQGPQGSTLTVVVRHGAEDTIIPLTRRAVPVPSVVSRINAETGVAYILFKEFNDNTPDQFSRELKKVIEAGADSLIFDVRDNKGGSLSSVSRILDRLMPVGVIYSATYKDGRTEVIATSDANSINLPMVVLHNAGTASAAELFVQDLKDLNNAKSVGVATMGKGVMQGMIKLSDGSAIELTTALFNPSSGVNFNGVGIKPDYDVVLEGDWSGMDESTDLQLKKAIEVVLAAKKAAETALAAEESSSESQPESEPPSSVQEPSSSQPPSSSETSSETSSESSSESSSETSSESSSESESEAGGSTSSESGVEEPATQ